MNPAGAGRGWGRVLALSLICITFSVVQPALLVFVPFGLLALAMPPHRPIAILAGLILLGTALAGMRPQGFAAIERGWALLAGGWFVLAVVLLPQRGFVSRGLVAVATTMASMVMFMRLRGGSLQALDEQVTERLRASAEQAGSAWTRLAGERGAELSETIQRVVQVQTELQVMLYPALLALATLAGLAVAWWAWGRLAVRTEGALAPLREFRFSDSLVWLLIVGLVMVLVPALHAARAGSNLLAFMGALYALRGLGVLLFFGGMPGPLGMVVGLVMLVLLYPFVMATTFMVGLFDTWLDIRTRRPTSPGADA